MRPHSDTMAATGTIVSRLISPVPPQRLAGGRGLKVKLFNIWGGNRVPAVISSISTPNGGRVRKHHQQRNVTLTFEQNLEERHLREAGEMLIERERRLFGEINEAGALVGREEEVDKLASDRRALEDVVLRTLAHFFDEDGAHLEALGSAVQAVQKEEEQDQLWSQARGTAPVWRPCGWRKLHDSVLQSLAEERLNEPSTATAGQVRKPSVQADLQGMGRQLRRDLLQVVKEVKGCYPSQLDISQLYATLYHRTVGSRLRKMAEFVLDDDDCTFLLTWMHRYYPDILQEPQFAGAINTEDLGELLPKALLKPLEEQYISKQLANLTKYTERVLQEERDKWDQGQEPIREDGCFSSDFGYDIIQIINGMITSAEYILRDWKKAHRLTCNLQDLMQRFSIFQDDLIKQNKPTGKSFVKANLGCVQQLRDFFVKKSHLFPDDIQESCLNVLKDMKLSAHVFLLSPGHKSLKPHYRKLGTSEWLNKSSSESLLMAVEQEIQELEGACGHCHQELIGQFHQEVTIKYVQKLLKGNIKLKDQKEQLRASDTVTDDAERLNALFLKQGSMEIWLKPVLLMLAGVLKLQDLSAIKMEVVSLGTSFPDLSDKHISALLKLKTTVSRGDRRAVKAILSDMLRETTTANSQPFFSRVQL